MRLYASIYIIAYLLLLVIAMMMPMVTEGELSFLRNSMSELGAQQRSGNWVINTSIAIMSIATLIYGSFALKRDWIQLVALYFFGISYGLTSMFHLAGYEETIHYNYTHDALHFLFSTITGFAFIMLCVTIFFKIVVKAHKLQTTITFLAAIELSLLQYQFPEYLGIFQRLMFIICFGWLFYALTCYNFEGKDTPDFNRLKRYKSLKKHLSKDEK